MSGRLPERRRDQDPAGFLETADIETASEGYARRFSGAVGAWFLALQERLTLELLADLPAGATVLDVGGGHAQIAPSLCRSGFGVVVTGSADSCAARLDSSLGAAAWRFDVADCIDLPYDDDAFDAVVCFRLVPHCERWPRLIEELCRVARRCVLVDFPSRRSFGLIADPFFGAKRRIERNTRRFTSFHPREIEAAFRTQSFRIAASRAQFAWPMVLHRAVGSAALSAGMEAPARWVGITRWLGSPVIVKGVPMLAQGDTH